jgi:transposase-like protein
MTKKTRRKFTAEAKAKAVADYVAGIRTALQIAKDLGVEVHSIYQWRAAQDEKKRGLRLSELQGDSGDPDLAERVLRQEEEIAVYQKKVAELSVMVDLLKKLQTSGPYQPESELSGLIAITKKSDRKRKRSK